jgi:hypothetical protein
LESVDEDEEQMARQERQQRRRERSRRRRIDEMSNLLDPVPPEPTG